MKKQNLITKIIFKIIVYAALIAMTVSILVPVAWVFMASFKRNAEFIGQGTNPWALPEQLQYQNYITAFVDAEMGKYFLNSVIVTALSLALLLVIALPAAYALSRFDFKGKKLLFGIVLVTFMIPFSAIALPLYQIVSGLHMVDTYWGLILPAVANGLSIFLFRQTFMDIPSSYLEAARLDGASWPMIYFSVYMRMSISIIISAGIIIFMDQWEAFLWPLIAGRSQSMKVIQVAIADLSQDNEIYWNQIFAACTISIVVPVAIVLPLQKYYIMGISSSGVKE